MKKYIISILLGLVAMTGVVHAYDVQVGDTLCGIADKFNVSCETLIENNPQIDNPNLIHPGDEVYTGDEMFIGAVLPEDGYDTFLSAPAGISDTEIFVSSLPTGTESVYTIFASDGVTVSEKVYCTGWSASPNKLTGCIRGISPVFVNGQIDETGGTGSSHSKNARIAITDNINFTGKALNMLFGNQQTSSTQFIFGQGNTTNLPYRIYFHSNSATSSDSFIDWDGTNLGWSDNGSDTYDFVTGGSGLTASTTKGIGITDSKIYVNASSTGGLEFNSSDGALQVKSGNGIKTDSTGTQIDGSDTVAWTAEQQFATGTIKVGEGYVTSTPEAYGVPQADSDGKIDIDYLTNEAKNIFTGTAGESLDLSSGPLPVYINNVYDPTIITTVDTDQTNDSGTTKLESTNIKLFQSFNSGSYNVITGVEFYLSRSTNTGTDNFLIDIFDVDGSGNPTGSSLGTITYAYNSIPSSATFVEFTFDSPVKVTTSTQYALVLSRNDYTGTTPITINKQAVGTYTNGTFKSSSDSGDNWTDTGSDQDLLIYGYNLETNGKVYESTSPTTTTRVRFHGFVTAPASAGADEEVTVQNTGVVKGFSGLYEGYNYFLTETGGISIFIDSYDCLVGTALSSTELLITRNN